MKYNQTFQQGNNMKYTQVFKNKEVNKNNHDQKHPSLQKGIGVK
jgi:hypothetical protein